MLPLRVCNRVGVDRDALELDLLRRAVRAVRRNLFYALQDVHAVYDAAEDGVAAIKLCVRSKRHKELTACSSSALLLSAKLNCCRWLEPAC